MFKIRKNISAKNLDFYLRHMVTDEAHLSAWLFLKEHGKLMTISTTSRKGRTESVGYDYKGLFEPQSYVDSQIEWYSKKLNI